MFKPNLSRESCVFDRRTACWSTFEFSCVSHILFQIFKRTTLMLIWTKRLLNVEDTSLTRWQIQYSWIALRIHYVTSNFLGWSPVEYRLHYVSATRSYVIARNPETTHPVKVPPQSGTP